MKKVALVFFISVVGLTHLMGQGQDHEKDKTHHQADEEFNHHRLLFEFGYTFIPDGFEELEGDQVVWVPTLGLSYVYHFNHKWGVGLTANFETAKYQVMANGEDITRENLLIIAAVATYEILPNWGVFIGPGIEIETHHNFAVLRIGTEYIFTFKKNWFITPIVTFDYKTGYSSLEFAVGIGKRF